MDSQLRAAWRQYLGSQTVADYFIYLNLCKRAGVDAECMLDSEFLVSNGPSCPHCILQTKCFDDVNLEGITKLFLEGFTLSPSQTFVALQPELRSDSLETSLYYAALVLTMLHFDPTCYVSYPDNFKISQLLVQNEFCYGESLSDDDYGFDEDWPCGEWLEGSPPDLFDRVFSIRRMRDLIYSLYTNAVASQIEIEIVPIGRESIRPDLGPINIHAKPYLRLTMLGKDGEQSFDYETLFIFPAFLGYERAGMGAVWRIGEYEAYIQKHTVE